MNLPDHVSALPADGERFLPHQQGDIRLEHVHRYLLAAGYCRGMRVLDIACGEGYGSSMLARIARRVTGVDIDAAVIEAAGQAYGAAANLEFVTADCRETGLPAASFDVIVSFETIEHLPAPEPFLDECRRLLADDGLLILSTPNRERYRARDGVANPFHQHELERAELATLLESRFNTVRFHGQQVERGSLIAPLDASGPDFSLYHENEARMVETGAVRQPVYYLVFAGDRPLAPAGPSFFGENVSTESGALIEPSAWAAALISFDDGTGLRPADGLRRFREGDGAVRFRWQSTAPVAPQTVRLRIADQPCLAKLVSAAYVTESGELKILHPPEANAIDTIEGCDAFISFDPGYRFFVDERFAALEFLIEYGAVGLRAVQDMAPAVERRPSIRAADGAMQPEIDRLRRLLEHEQGELHRMAVRSERLESELARLRTEMAQFARTTRPGIWRKFINRLKMNRTLNGLAQKVNAARGVRGQQRQRELVRASGLFDEAWYREAYPEIAAAGLDPLTDFLFLGWKQGRRPNPHFDPEAYLRRRPDVAVAGVNPLYHYIRHGRREDARCEKDERQSVVPVVEKTAADLLAAALERRAGGARPVVVPLESWRPVAAPAKRGGAVRLAACLHVHYPELLPHLLKQVARIPEPFDLFVSTHERVADSVRAMLHRERVARAINLAVTPNRGRNFAPLVIALGPHLAGYEVALHLHTKKSAHLDYLSGWRSFLIRKLIGSREQAASILRRFDDDAKLGVLAPPCFPPLLSGVVTDPWGENGELARMLAPALGLRLRLDGPLVFPVGGMFWFRPAALRSLFGFGLDWDAFSPEGGATDGTLAHTLERLICLIATSSGYTWQETGD